MQLNIMKLFGSHTSPYVRHCRIALDALSIAYDFVETDYIASAKGSAMMRVPYLEHASLQLTDSSSILMYLYERAGLPFIKDAQEMEEFCMINTIMDATINVFLLERDKITPENSAYLKRQTERINSGLTVLNSKRQATSLPLSISATRLACYLDWARFRNRINLSEFAELERFVEMANTWEVFSNTAPRV